MKRKRRGGATVRPTLIQPEIPHITQGCESTRSHDTRPMYRVPQKTQFSHLSFLPSLAFLRIGNAEDVRLRFYRQFRLCITTAHLGGRKGIGLSPYPYAVDVTSFDCEGNITTVFSPSIYSYQKGLNHLNNQKETKTSIIPFRVTPEERAWIEKQSYGNYRRISDFVRDCVFEKDIVIVKGLDEFSLELRRIGNNLNQLTRAVNAGIVRAVDLTETKEEVEKLWQSLNSLLRDAQ